MSTETFLSADRCTEIHYHAWLPEGTPGAVLVLPNVLFNALSMAESVGQALACVLGSALVLLPTVILTAIYLFCRRRHRQQKQIDKMNIQDL